VEGVVITVVIAFLFGGMATAYVLRNRPQLRETRDLRRRTKQLSRERRRDLARALRGGRAVRDPRDAALAADLAEHQGRVFRRFSFGKGRYVILAVEILIGIGLLVRAITEPGLELIAALLPLLLAVGFHLSRGYNVRRLERAEATNQTLADEFRLGGPPEDDAQESARLSASTARS
jgi:hypothetical protein